MAVDALLRARGLERRHGSRLIVAVDTLTLARGEVLALLGPNGAGKSTLLRLLLGLERPDAGELLLDGRAVRPDDAELRRRSAATLQRPTLFAGSVLDNARYGPAARGLSRDVADARAQRALEGMGVAHLSRKSARSLSGGEVQRVAVARALAVGPDLLGLDEPTAGMDVAGQREFRQRLEAGVREMAGAALLVTHDPADAFALADRILVLEGGRVTQQGTPEELVAEPATPFVAAFTGAELLLDGTIESVRDDVATVRLAGGHSVSSTVALADGRPEIGTPVHIAYRPEDVLLLGAHSSEAASARNRFRLRVAAITPVGGLLRVRLEGTATLVSLITRAAATDLGIAPGIEVTALVKATALRAYAAAAARPS